MAERLVFTGKQESVLESFELHDPAPDEVSVDVHYSLLSNGTETIVYNRNFESGTGWDNWVKYPFYPGYACVGEVGEVGSSVTSLRKGDRVAIRTKHASAVNIAASQCIPIPDEVSLTDAAWFALAKIAFMGVLAASYRIGNNLLIIGAGPIGQMSVRWANAAGLANIIVADLLPNRLEMARIGGATSGIETPLDSSHDRIKAILGGKMPGIVIDSTGNYAVFESALRAAADRGRVLILGDTGMPSNQHLTHDVIGRGLVITGAHDVHDTGEWNNSTISALFFEMLKRGRMSVAGLVTTTFKSSEAATVHDYVSNHRSEIMGVMIDWKDAK